MAQGRIHVPLVPSVAGALATTTAAYRRGQALTVSFGLTCVARCCWRAVDGLLDAVRDIAGGSSVAVYLAAVPRLLLHSDAERPRDGAWRVFVLILVTVCKPGRGYAVGVVAGRHPMAPSVSPKKSWEGFAEPANPSQDFLGLTEGAMGCRPATTPTA